jgi:ligand-binding SRPBCC domain-containing protein
VQVRIRARLQARRTGPGRSAFRRQHRNYAKHDDPPRTIRTLGSLPHRTRLPLLCKSPKPASPHASRDRHTHRQTHSRRAAIPQSCAIRSGHQLRSEIHTSFRVLALLPFRARWIARIAEFEWNRPFADIQAKGSFHTWHTANEFAAAVRNGIPGTLVRDQIRYSIGFDPLGAAGNRLFVPRQLQQTFQRRQETLPGLLATS